MKLREEERREEKGREENRREETIQMSQQEFGWSLSADKLRRARETSEKIYDYCVPLTHMFLSNALFSGRSRHQKGCGLSWIRS